MKYVRIIWEDGKTSECGPSRDPIEVGVAVMSKRYNRVLHSIHVYVLEEGHDRPADEDLVASFYF